MEISKCMSATYSICSNEIKTNSPSSSWNHKNESTILFIFIICIALDWLVTEASYCSKSLFSSDWSIKSFISVLAQFQEILGCGLKNHTLPRNPRLYETGKKKSNQQCQHNKSNIKISNQFYFRTNNWPVECQEYESSEQITEPGALPHAISVVVGLE